VVERSDLEIYSKGETKYSSARDRECRIKSRAVVAWLQSLWECRTKSRTIVILLQPFRECRTKSRAIVVLLQPLPECHIKSRATAIINCIFASVLLTAVNESERSRRRRPGWHQATAEQP